MTKHRLVPLAARFWSHVNKLGPIIKPELGPCWVWKGGTGSDGYGLISEGRRVTKNGGRMLRAHRVAWTLQFGPIPDDQQVCHACDNTICVRWSHLFLGTNQQNAVDMVQKGRHWRQSAKDVPLRKLTKAQISQILLDPRSGRAAAPSYGVDHRTINRIRREHGGGISVT